PLAGCAESQFQQFALDRWMRITSLQVANLLRTQATSCGRMVSRSNRPRARGLQDLGRREHETHRRRRPRTPLAYRRGVGFHVIWNARITAIDAEGKSFVADVGENDLWYFPTGIPHSIQGLNPDGALFLLVFDDGNFSEYATVLL